MKSLALRKARVNAIGVVGLVENMPGGNAQRPGDIVKSYSGKTVEILNTDAEGRLVLADALTFTEEKYSPKFIVDLATLTGAIIVSLGSEYAGLFSNDDKLSKQLIDVGEKTEEKVWRMPLNKNFDKLIDSKNADMQNKLCWWCRFNHCSTIFTKIYFKQNTVGTFRYSWNGFFKVRWSSQFRWCNRIWS